MRIQTCCRLSKLLNLPNRREKASSFMRLYSERLRVGRKKSPAAHPLEPGRKTHAQQNRQISILHAFRTESHARGGDFGGGGWGTNAAQATVLAATKNCVVYLLPYLPWVRVMHGVLYFEAMNVYFGPYPKLTLGTRPV